MFSSLLVILVATTSTLGIGDFLCSNQTIPGQIDPNVRSCQSWANNSDGLAQGNISPSAICQPDPQKPTTSYCGYASAICANDLDCDYGSCAANGFCSGYFGSPCGSSLGCQGYLFCGSDGTCGGLDAPCGNIVGLPNPDGQCSSNQCSNIISSNVNGSTISGACTAIPSAGLPVGSPCTESIVCSGTTTCVLPSSQNPTTSIPRDSILNTCQSAVVPPLAGPSQVAASTKKTKRYVLNGSGPQHSECDRGMQACAVGEEGEGFECIDSKTNLERCGGCVLDGEGRDCTEIIGVESVSCQSGHCVVLSCRPGLELSTNGHACTAHR